MSSEWPKPVLGIINGHIRAIYWIMFSWKIYLKEKGKQIINLGK